MSFPEDDRQKRLRSGDVVRADIGLPRPSRAYTPPRLKLLGSVSELTMGVSGTSPEVHGGFKTG